MIPSSTSQGKRSQVIATITPGSGTLAKYIMGSKSILYIELYSLLPPYHFYILYNLVNNIYDLPN